MARKLQESEDDNQVREFQQCLCEIAATCRGTYDVDPLHAPYLLDSRDDVAVLIECAILVYDNTPPNLAEVPVAFKKLLDHDRRLSHLLESLLSGQIQEDRSGLDRAITAIWPAYQPGAEWKQLASPNDHLLSTETTVEADRRSQHVQLDLLQGRLLIDGKPLGRLPQDIMKHPTYSQVLGQVSNLTLQ